MRTRATPPVPARLEGTRRQFEQWRRNRQGRSRIPKSLWAAAAKAAATYGLCRTARTLGLDYTALKRHVAAGGRADPKPGTGNWGGGVPVCVRTRTGRDDQGAVGGAAFVELPVVASGGGCECLLELEDSGGARMRLYLKGAAVPDLAALSRSFWSAGS